LCVLNHFFNDDDGSGIIPIKFLFLPVNSEIDLKEENKASPIFQIFGVNWEITHFSYHKLSDYWNILKLFTGIKNVFLLEKYYMKFISDLPEKFSFLPDGLFIALLKLYAV